MDPRFLVVTKLHPFQYLMFLPNNKKQVKGYIYKKQHRHAGGHSEIQLKQCGRLLRCPVLQQSFKDLDSLKIFCPKIHLHHHPFSLDKDSNKVAASTLACSAIMCTETSTCPTTIVLLLVAFDTFYLLNSEYCKKSYE